jgi:hypothetical protein
VLVPSTALDTMQLGSALRGIVKASEPGLAADPAPHH